VLFGGVASNNGFPVPGTNNVVGQDPLLVAPGANPLTANFQLNAGSPAIGIGSSLYSRTADFAGNPVSATSPIDAGAYEAPGH
jgi:hypothetical protein